MDGGVAGEKGVVCGSANLLPNITKNPSVSSDYLPGFKLRIELLGVFHPGRFSGSSSDSAAPSPAVLGSPAHTHPGEESEPVS